MKKLLTSIALCATLALSSCGVLDGTIDKGVIGGKDLVTHTSEELGKLKTEVLVETQEMVSELKTETLQEVRVTIEEMMPQVVETFLNADAVAFLIVGVTGLGALVVLVALLLLLGTARAWWKRLSNRSNPPVANT